jgi:transcriptional regulator with XRE-family HTH domain
MPPPTPPARRRRPPARIAGAREAAALVATLGREVRAARLALGLTQAQLAALVGLEQARISEIERARGGGTGLETWICLGIALERPLAIGLSRPARATTADGGHLPGQELVLRLARGNAIPGTFELPTRPSNPSRMVDVGLRDDRRRVLTLTEISNRIDDLGQTIRDHKRKVAEAKGLATAIGGDEGPYRVAFCWILVASAVNRELVARYPHIFDVEFPGSSRAWVRALTDGADPPLEPGLVWVDLAGTRLFERRSG